jgi:hypothetical protein
MSDKKQHSENTESIDRSSAAGKPWSWYKKFGFRVLFIFFLAMSIPLAGNWYSNVFTLNWLRPHYRDLYDIARFQPNFRSFFGGQRYGDITDAPTDNPSGNGDNSKGRGKRHRGDKEASNNADTSNAGGRKRHRHEKAGDGASASNEERPHHKHHRPEQAAGDGALASNDERPHNRRHHQEQGGDSTLVSNDDRPHNRRHRRELAGDSTLVNNDHPRRHHRREQSGDSTLTNNDRPHNRHHRGEQAGDTVLASNGRHHNRHHRDSLTTDSTDHGLAKIGGGENKNDRAGSRNDALPPHRSFLEDYTDWGIALLIAIAGAIIWTLFDRKSKSYHILYYWIRVVVRYRAGIGIIGFGFTKLFPTQMPYPSLGLLNSNFGDFTAQKIYWMSVGIVPWYQVFGGVVEIVAGTMLFFRKTTTFGAILLAAALGDITFVNYAYDGGVHVYAFYFVLLGLFLAADDFPKLYNLLILERYTVPYRVYPDFRKPWLKYTRIGLKALTFIIFFGVLTYTEVINFKYDPYKQPSTAGVKKLRGNYHVTEFKVNGQDIPYNPLDSTRWQEATFENWTTLTFKVNRPVLIDPSNGGGSPMRDIQRTFEITGVAGGERAFHYYADTIDRVLYLQDKNAIASRGGGRGSRRGGNGNGDKAGKPKQDNWISKTAWQHIGDEKNMIDKNAWSERRDREFAIKPREVKRSRMVLKYDTTDGSRVILSGINERKDSIYVVLDRYDRNYVLPKSTLSAGKY